MGLPRVTYRSTSDDRTYCHSVRSRFLAHTVTARVLPHSAVVPSHLWLIAPRSYHETGGFEPQTAAWSSSRWRELRASPTDSRHISYVQSHSIELNRSDLDFWPAHCGVTSHLWLHDSEQHAPGATWCVPLRRYTHPPHARMRLTGGKTECLTRTAFLSPRRADAASDRTTLTALSAIVALASSLED